MSKLPMARKTDILMQDSKGEILLYDLCANQAFCLNETSSLVWQLCDGTKSVSEISRELSKKLNLPIPEELVWLALDQLKKEHLLENDMEIAFHTNGWSRREVIKKVGLGTMATLPLITFLVAPTATQAASCISGGDSFPAPDAPTCFSQAATLCCSGGANFANIGGVTSCVCAN